MVRNSGLSRLLEDDIASFLSQKNVDRLCSKASTLMIYGASKVMRQQGLSPSKLKPPQFFSRGYKVDPLLSTITCRFYFC